MRDIVLIGILVISSFLWMGFGCWVLGDEATYKNNWKKRLLIYLMYGPLFIFADLVFNGLSSLIDKIYGAREKFRRFVRGL